MSDTTKKSLGKRLRGLIIEEDDKPQVRPVSTHPTQSVTFSQNPPLTPNDPIVGSAPAEKFESHVEEVFNEANIPGPDYFEFTKGVKAMEAVIPDRMTRFRAALAANVGLTKEHLLATANQYLSIFNNKIADVDSQTSATISSKIETLESQRRGFAATAEALQAQVERLKSELANAEVELAGVNEKISSLYQEQQAISRKIQSNGAGLKAALSARLQIIQEDITIINSL